MYKVLTLRATDDHPNDVARINKQTLVLKPDGKYQWYHCNPGSPGFITLEDALKRGCWEIYEVRIDNNILAVEYTATEVYNIKGIKMTVKRFILEDDILKVEVALANGRKFIIGPHTAGLLLTDDAIHREKEGCVCIDYTKEVFKDENFKRWMRKHYGHWIPSTAIELKALKDTYDKEQIEETAKKACFSEQLREKQILGLNVLKKRREKVIEELEKLNRRIRRKESILDSNCVTVEDFKNFLDITAEQRMIIEDFLRIRL